MAIARRLKIAHDEVFPHGAYLVSDVEPVVDYDRSTAENKVQSTDKDTGLPVWSVDVLDADPDATKKNRTVSVKILAKVQPVPPAKPEGAPFTLVVFEGLMATVWVDSTRCRPPEPGKGHRCGAQSAWSLRAMGMAAPGKNAQPSGPSKVA